MRSLATASTAGATKGATPAARRRMVDIADDEAEVRGRPQGRTVLALAALASFIWLAVAVATIYLLIRYLPPTEVTLVGLGGIAAGVTAPLTAIWLIALVFARAAPGETRAALNRIAEAEAHFAEVTARTRRELAAVDSVLTAVSGRVDEARASLGTQSESLLDATSYLEQRTAAVSAALGRDRSAILSVLEQLSADSSAASTELANVVGTLPTAQAQAVAIQRLLGDSASSAREQIGEVDLLLGSMSSRHEDLKARAEATAGDLRTTLAAIDAESTAAAQRLDMQSKSLEAAVDGAMARASDALEIARSAVDAQVGAVTTATDQAKAILVDLGQTTTRTVNEQLSVLANEAARLTTELAQHQALSGQLVESYGRSFGVLDAKLGNAAKSSNTTFEHLGERLTAILEQIHSLSVPLGETGAQTRALEVDVTTLRDNIVASGLAVDTVNGSVRTLASDIDAASATAAAIAGPVDAARIAVAAAANALGEQRESLDAVLAGMAAKLGSANKLVGEIEQGTEAAALAATTKLLEALVRARDVAAQAEGAMREALDRAIADSRSSLAAASDEAMRTSFTAPVTRQLAELATASETSADAARAAAERLSQQLFAVLETATLVETRIGETDSKLDAASRHDIARRGALLIDALNSSSIDIAKALAIDVSDSSWTAYLRGDRSIFTRRAVKLLDRVTARAIVKQYQTDGDLRDSVRRYINDFEQLMRSIASEREGGSLQIALLSSDTGKLYVALAQAMERIRS